MVPDVDGPGFGQSRKLRGIPGEEGPGRLFEAGQVSGHGRHESVGRLLRPPSPIPAGVRSPRLLDQFPERDGRTARLAAQPFPMTRQQRDLAGDDAQLRPPSTAGCVRPGRSRDRPVCRGRPRACRGSPPRSVRPSRRRKSRRRHHRRWLPSRPGRPGQFARSDALRSLEGRTAWLISGFHLRVPSTESSPSNSTRVNIDGNIIRVKLFRGRRGLRTGDTLGRENSLSSGERL